ncbi:MAG: hypothetical protein FJX52_10965, partial [Alphaproteobacteria bacterium]|nr:hypothetical protein [Alphaproteobacteria bacterium]
MYAPDPKTPGALPDNFIEAMHRDHLGQMWFGTNGLGLVRYDRNTGSFVNFGATRDGLSHDTVLGLTDDGTDGLWIATQGGLKHFDATSGTARAVPLASNDGKLTTGARVLTVLRARQGALWIGTDVGLYRRVETDGSFTRVELVTANAVPSRIYEDSSGRIWIGSLRHGAFVVAPGELAGRQVAEHGVPRPHLLNER